MKTMYLHIGTPKTGTTALQRFFYDNRNVLEEKNYCFPIFPFSYDDAPDVRNAHFLIKYIYDEEGNVDKEAFDKRFIEACDLIKDSFSRVDNVILTDEVLWNFLFRRSSNFFKKLREQFDEKEYDIKVIVYLRPQYAYIDSLYRQWVRMGRTIQSWDDFISDIPDRITVNYQEGVKYLEDSVGKENVIVRRYLKQYYSGESGTIFEDFLNTIGLELNDDFSVPEDMANVSMQNQYVELKRILNYQIENYSSPRNDLGNVMFRTACNTCSSLNYKEDSTTLYNEEQRKRLVERFEESNNWIAKNYFDDDVLFR